MTSELQKLKLDVSELPETLQSGELVIGLSSAIPGFIKRNVTHSAISFAPFFMRDHWIDLPIATVQELSPAPNANPMEKGISLALRPGGNNEKVLMDLIGALATNAGGLKVARGNGKAESAAIPESSSAEHGICRNCKRGDEYCVDCFLAI
ncbi:MAG: hypothetical protein GXX84_05980 [Acidobacteria bacterium]|nr:hypothetical protein [Acidobacteriota bacterium]